jgi:hypothetical protein
MELRPRARQDLFFLDHEAFLRQQLRPNLTRYPVR